ncbi:MAG: NAD(+) synthase, partial [bacterium JZ-2024 1]
MIRLELTPDELSVVRTIILESIRTRVQKAGANGVVLGLSGGVDSSLALVLAIEALGDRVFALILPESGVTPERDIRDAVRLARRKKVRFRVLEIRKLVESVLSLAGVVESPESQIGVGNIKPRLRMTLLYLAANLENLLVLGTSNKSELLM